MRKELTVHQVIGFWYDTIAGVVRVPMNSLPPKKHDDWVFDAKATRTICKGIVEEFPSFNEVVKRGLIAHHQGTDSLEYVIVASEFVGELGVWLQSNPSYPCYKVEGSRVEPKEYTLDEIALALGYSHRRQAKWFMDNHGYGIPGVGKMGNRWFMVGSTVDALVILRKNLKKCELLEENSVIINNTTEGVTTSAA
jgi:hypothetical protein